MIYGKCSKISNTFLFLFSNKMLVIMAGIHKMLARLVHREDADQILQKQSDLGLRCLSGPFSQASLLEFKILEHLPY